MDRDIQEFRRLIGDAQKIVAFTGAGISTESGIPDFRGPDGIWKKVTPIDFGEFVRSEDVRRESWRRKFTGADRMANAQPNAGHLAMAALYRMGKLTYVITQNVDGLHQKAGVPEDRVIELHGNTNYATCLSCGRRYELDAIRETFQQGETVPYCDDCGGIIKTATISFGQPMPVREMERAEVAVSDCDLFIVMGSSLVVYPAAAFPRVARQNGSRLVIVNNEPTDLDSICDLVLHRGIGETMTSVID
ncbi:MAG TPA: Sir2 family NAD-dependent protein deacetylase [Pseudomonadales bacterium]|nr:Sir2 family NAD-dependent protein deacetylase [Pseudomonadales bacterium]